MRIKFANSATERIFGYSKRELLRQSIGVIFPKSQYQRYKERIAKYFTVDEDDREGSGLNNVIDVLAQKKTGEVFPVEVSLGNSSHVGVTSLLTCILRDVSLRKKADRRLKYLAFHDRLTSLGNRDRFSQTLKVVLDDVGAGEDHRAALLYLDLDGFKKVNDSLGHETGDSILKACAQRLSNSLRLGDQVYQFDFEEIFRLGGDEFTILLPYIRNSEDAAIVANRVIDRITEPFVIEEVKSIEDVRLGVSVGIVIIPDDGTDSTVLLRNADAAMYKAKERGNRFVFFTEDMNSMAVERLMLEQGVHQALSRNQFELYYQPIFDADGTPVYVEALARWNHPERGVVSPGVFLPVIEDVGLSGPFGTWVLSTACRDIKLIRARAEIDVKVSVNLSPTQLDEPDIAEIIRKTLERREVPADVLTIELTEDAIMSNPDRAKRKLQAIKRLNPGITIAIDDFGTGYSSLAYLTTLPADKMKIDRSFVMQMHEGDNAKVVQTIIDLGRTLKLKIIAEGVETQDQFESLRSSMCDLYQGYLFLRPATLEDLEQSLRSYSSDPSVWSVEDSSKGVTRDRR